MNIFEILCTTDCILHQLLPAAWMCRTRTRPWGWRTRAAPSAHPRTPGTRYSSSRLRGGCRWSNCDLVSGDYGLHRWNSLVKLTTGCSGGCRSCCRSWTFSVGLSGLCGTGGNWHLLAWGIEWLKLFFFLFLFQNNPVLLATHAFGLLHST